MAAQIMTQCVTCGAELHPERAVKYDYCMAPGCQEKNARGLTMVAVGMNKAADELMILDDPTREALASGRYRDQRRGFYGSLAPAQAAAVRSSRGTVSANPATAAAAAGGPEPIRLAGQQARGRPAARQAPAPRPPARPRWTPKQERLARIYNEQGLKPGEIARKLGVSTYLATQIVLAARGRREP